MPPPRLSLFSRIRYGPFISKSPLTHLRLSQPLPNPQLPSTRAFTTTPIAQNYLLPRRNVRKFKTRKGRPHVPTGGSIRGTTVVWGQYGLRLRSHDGRISAAQLKNGEDVIRRRLRGASYRLYTRICCNVAVYTKGNEARMGTGKGSFDYWAARVGPSRVVFELSGGGHEQVVRDAFRLAGNKLPGQWEFVKRGDPGVMGITKLGNGVTEESLRRPRKMLPLQEAEIAVSDQSQTKLGNSVTNETSRRPRKNLPLEKVASGISDGSKATSGVQ